MIITLTLQIDNDLSDVVARAFQNVAEHVGNHGYNDGCWETAETWQGINNFRIDRRDFTRGEVA
jgi:hypothetical protein